MKAILKGVHSPDISDLIHYKPDNEDTFGLLLQLFIKPNTEDGFESFDVMVVTPKWLAETHSKDDIIIGRHYLIVFEYNYEQIINTINKFLLDCTGHTWKEVAEKVSRLGKWEFEDYIDKIEDQ